MKSFLSAFTALSLAVPAAAQTFQPAKLPAASRDTFEVIYQGQPVGTFVISLSRGDGNYTFAGEARLAPMGMVSIDSVSFNAKTLAPTAMSSHMSMQGMNTVSSVTVVDGKAAGTAQTPTPGGITSTAINATVAPGVIGDGSDFALLPTAPLAEGFTASYQIFDAKTGATKTSQLKVVGKETVTIPLGTFETWKVQLISSESSTAFVTIAEPHRIVMMRLDSQGVEMRRISK